MNVALRSPGLNGLAVALAAAGGVVLVAGFRNVTISDTLRGILKGSLPAARPMQTNLAAAAARAAAGGGGASADFGPGVPTGDGAKIAAEARHYLGRPYSFGAAGPDSFDCSGLVTWVLHHDLGYTLPDDHHTVTGQFYVWSGATTVPRLSCQAGDLVCWPSHMGIATGQNTMIHAPGTGQVVKEGNIWSGCIIRRVKSQAVVTK